MATMKASMRQRSNVVCHSLVCSASCIDTAPHALRCILTIEQHTKPSFETRTVVSYDPATATRYYCLCEVTYAELCDDKARYFGPNQAGERAGAGLTY